MTYVIKKFVNNINDLCSDTSNISNMFTMTIKYSFENYIMRFKQHARIELEYLLFINVYFDKLYNNGYRFTKEQILKMFSTLIVIFIKMYHDEFYSMDIYCQIAGIQLNEFNKIEFEMYNMMNYNAFVSESEYEAQKIEYTILQ